MAAITLTSVTKRFGEVTAVSDVNFEIAEGEFVCLIGPSGCGKTTLLRIIAGIEDTTAGDVFIDGGSPESLLQKRQIGFVFQRAALLPHLTARENVELTLQVTKKKGLKSSTEILTDFGLGEFLDHYPGQLSGGMQQRVNFACAMVHDPAILLMDEPFGGLDELKREEMGEWLHQVLDSNPKTVVFVTHSVEEAVFLGHRVVIMSPQPGEIYREMEIPFPTPRSRHLKTQSQFLDIVGLVREAVYSVVYEERRDETWEKPGYITS